MTFSKIKFDLSDPFLPIEQLLCVLPPTSAALVPEHIRFLMLSESSPIIDYFPLDFETDQNGKKQEWEAIALLPFVDYSRLSSALSPFIDKLAALPENQFGDEKLYIVDTSCSSYVLASTLPRYLPDTIACIVQVCSYKNPRIPPDGLFRPELCKGVTVPFATFPYLKSLPIRVKLVKNSGVNVFGRNSKKESLIVEVDHVKHKLSNASLEALALNCVNRLLFIDYPFFRLALVDEVSDGKFSISKYSLLKLV
jgi:5'-3' exoribonuclease 1